MSTEKMREEFEVWVSKKYPNESLDKCRADQGFIYCVGDYFVPSVHVAWLSWQASRAAIEVKLPPSPYMPDSDHDSMSGYEIGEAQGRCDMWVSCREAIESLGLKVKA